MGSRLIGGETQPLGLIHSQVSDMAWKPRKDNLEDSGCNPQASSKTGDQRAAAK